MIKKLLLLSFLSIVEDVLELSLALVPPKFLLGSLPLLRLLAAIDTRTEPSMPPPSPEITKIIRRTIATLNTALIVSATTSTAVAALQIPALTSAVTYMAALIFTSTSPLPRSAIAATVEVVAAAAAFALAETQS